MTYRPNNTALVGQREDSWTRCGLGGVPSSNEVNNNSALYPAGDGDRDMAVPYVLCYSGPVSDEDNVIHSLSFPTKQVDQMYTP